jgi:protein-S-isoprenylcysteine O-methyltransferase Ste14
MSNAGRATDAARSDDASRAALPADVPPPVDATHSTPGRLSSLKNSWAYQHRLGVTAAVLGAGWVFVAFTEPAINEGTPLAWALNAVAWVSFLAGSFMRIWATTWIAGRKRQSVVNDGPYALCRNPLYVGTFLMGLGLGLFLKSIVFAIALLSIVALYLKFVVPAEEAYLTDRLGEPYRQYCADVPRWFPSMRRLRRPEVGHPIGDGGALRGEWLRMIYWMLLPLLALATCYVRPVAWKVPWL